jgi:hypothetical protein
MFQDWQTIAVWMIILAALIYLGRGGLARLRSFRAGGEGQASPSSCASGCGSCGGDEPPKATATRPQNVLVQIKGAGSAARRPK